jgi:hypothetical protein
MHDRREWTVMNQYGAIAEKHWREFLPERYAQIPDPKDFFSQMGEEMEDQIIDLMMDLAGDDQPGEGYWDKVGRLEAAKQMAREKVLAETLPDPELEPTTSN